MVPAVPVADQPEGFLAAGLDDGAGFGPVTRGRKLGVDKDGEEQEKYGGDKGFHVDGLSNFC
jgi:hypothetical protein